MRIEELKKAKEVGEEAVRSTQTSGDLYLLPGRLASQGELLEALHHYRGAAQTFERATLLLDQPFHQAVGPGELDIPSVRGVGGSLIYFLDKASDLKAE